MTDCYLNKNKKQDPQEGIDMGKNAKSGNPAKRAEQAKAVSSVSAFKNKAGGLLTLPSGLVVKARNSKGLRAFVEAGVIPNSLMTIIQEAIDKGKEPDSAKLQNEDGTFNEAMVADMLNLTDTVVIQVVVDPVIHSDQWTTKDYLAGNCDEEQVGNRISEGDRDDDTVYVDDLDDEDKMFIFQWTMGGTRDLERFRQESSSTMDDISRRPVLGLPAESHAGATTQ